MSKLERRWEILEEVKEKRKDLSYEEIVRILLKNRGINTPGGRKEFFNPTHPDKLTLRALGINNVAVEKSVARVKEASKKGESIVIYGDYDVDGISATGILFETLYKVTPKVYPHLPNRFKEGYGLNPQSIEELKSIHPDLGLIITVDNGITAFDGVEKAKDLGIDVIITDHHKKKNSTPHAFASIYTKEIGGAAIAWIFAREIRRKLAIKEEDLKRGDGLELSGLGTIADVLPLIGPNRSFAWHGIRALRETNRPGFLALYDQARISSSTIGPYEVGYIIAPRLNAAGRLGNALAALQLICTANLRRAEDVALQLGKANADRQKMQEEHVLHAWGLAGQIEGRKVLVIAHESYNEGVIGLVAGKLSEEFHRPTVVLSRGKDVSKASGRSIPGFNLIAALEKLEEEFSLKLGGHEMAAGFTIATSQIENFSRRFEEIATPNLPEKILTRKLTVDLKLPFSTIDHELLGRLSDFEPNGAGNPAPTFFAEGVSVLDVRKVGAKETHLKLKLRQNNAVFAAIAFNQAGHFPLLSPESKIDVVYALNENTWNGRTSLELKIKDLRMNK